MSKMREMTTMDAILSPRRRSVVLGLGALALGGCSRAPAPIAGAGYLHFSGSTMGSTFNVRLRVPTSQEPVLRGVVQSALDEVDQRMSMFRKDSELSAFNRAPGGVPYELSESLYAVLAAADGVSRWSGGAFDITVAPLVEQWGFGTRAVRAVPHAAVLAAERDRVDWRGLTFDASKRAVMKQKGPQQVDLGGIAKGWGVDRAAAALEARGIADYMVEVGGEVRTRGVNAAGVAWRIGIEEPDASPQQARWIVPLGGRSMATSGDYRNYFTEGGRRYSHEIDPVSGAPVRHGLASVTVVADDCMQADALATALIVLGADKGRALAESSGVAAQFIERLPGGGFRDTMTPSFAALEAARA
jgi:thiamine biosynthesis lipoprotein